MGMKSRQKTIMECSGPRCSRFIIMRSMSGSTEIRKIKGRFKSTYRILDAAFPDRYPKAKCPTAYIGCPFKYLRFAVCVGNSSILRVI